MTIAEIMVLTDLDTLWDIIEPTAFERKGAPPITREWLTACLRWNQIIPENMVTRFTPNAECDLELLGSMADGWGVPVEVQRLAIHELQALGLRCA